MKKVYPALIAEDDKSKEYFVYVPDMGIYTEGSDFADAIEMARDAIGCKGVDMEDSNIPLPDASTYDEAIAKAKAEADEIFDYSTGTPSFIDIDFYEYRKKNDMRAVRKNCTIPSWLNTEAEKASINFSAVLQDALKKELHLARK
jgi:predicted RNase H-like HicB family nuclease